MQHLGRFSPLDWFSGKQTNCNWHKSMGYQKNLDFHGLMSIIFWVRAKYLIRAPSISDYPLVHNLFVSHIYHLSWDNKSTKIIFENFGFGYFSIFLKENLRKNWKIPNFQNLIYFLLLMQSSKNEFWWLICIHFTHYDAQNHHVGNRQTMRLLKIHPIEKETLKNAQNWSISNDPLARAKYTKCAPRASQHHFTITLSNSHIYIVSPCAKLEKS